MTIDLAAKVKNIYYEESQREYLTLEELNQLATTPCDSEILKRAALFSALTGLRHSDIKQLKWRDIVKDKEHYQLHFTQQKTKGVEYMPISDQAYSLCGERGDADRLVFEGLQDPSWINRPVKRWIDLVSPSTSPSTVFAIPMLHYSLPMAQTSIQSAKCLVIKR